MRPYQIIYKYRRYADALFALKLPEIVSKLAIELSQYLGIFIKSNSETENAHSECYPKSGSTLAGLLSSDIHRFSSNRTTFSMVFSLRTVAQFIKNILVI